MAAVLLSLYLWHFFRTSSSSPSLIKSLNLGFLGFICILTRPEFALITLLSPLIFLLHNFLTISSKRNRNVFLALVITFACIVLYGIFRWIYFGRFFPCPFYVKGSIWNIPYKDFDKFRSMNLIRMPVNYFKDTFLIHMAIFLGLIHQGRCKKYLWLWLPLYLSIFYISTTFQMMGYGYRYYFPFMGGILYLIIVLWRKEEGPLGNIDPGKASFLHRAFPISVIPILVIMAIGLYNGPKRFIPPPKDILHRMLDRLPAGVSLAATEIGELSAFNPDLVIYDLSGLNDLEFCHGFNVDDLFERNPDVISYVHDHYRDIVRQITTHPGFENYICAVNTHPDNKNISFNSSIYVNINSPRAGAILDSLRFFSRENDIISKKIWFGFKK